MKHIFSLYLRLIGVQIRSQLNYRFNFLVDVLATAFVTVTVFVSLAFIFQRFDNIAGWKLPEIAFLYGMVESAFGVMDMVFSGFDPQNFGKQVRYGRLDQLLLRPVNLIVQIFGSEFILRRIGRIVQGAIILTIALHSIPLEWTFTKVLYLPLLFISIVAFFGGLFIIGATITFWTLESIEVINILTYGGAEMMSYPMSIYPLNMRRFFTYVIPAIFLIYYPSVYLLDKPDLIGQPAYMFYLSPIAGFSVLTASLIFWKFGVKHYQSTGT